MKAILVKKLLFLALISFLFSCTTFDKSKLKNLNNNEVLKIGHGGSGFASLFPFNPYPANSISSIKQALLDNHADGVEVDVHMTLDNNFVIYHDRKLDSKTNKEGCIELMTYKEVVSSSYKLGFPFDLFQSERLIGLDNLIKECKKLEEFPYLHFDLRLFSDCLTDQKNKDKMKLFYHQLVEFLDSSNIPKEKIILISLRRNFIKYAKEQQSPYLLSFEEYGAFEEGLEFAKENKIKYLTMKPQKLSKNKVKIAHDNGVKIITFGANSKKGNKKLLELNPDIIQTNNMTALQDLLQ